jgi:UDP-N-acetylmuramate--alanine ligase
VLGRELEPYQGRLRIPGDHNRRNAACALAALALAGVPRADAERALVDFAGSTRRVVHRGEVRGVRVIDDYGHHPTEVSATIAAARELGAGRVLVLFQPHLPSRTRHLAHEFGAALSEADTVAVTDVYLAREPPAAGVTGKLIVDAVAERRPGISVAWTPRVEDGGRLIASLARSGDVVLTVGAGDVDTAVPVVLEALA